MAGEVTTALDTVVDEIMWSGDVPDLEFTAADHINIEVEVDGTVIFSTTLYAINNHCELVELAEIIEQNMVDSGVFLSEVKVYDVDGSDPTIRTLLTTFQVVYCSYSMSNDVEDFCRQNFLTTAHAKRLDSDTLEQLFFFDPDSGNETLKMQVGYMDNGILRVATVNNASTLISTDCVEFDLDAVAELADVDDIRTVTFTLGERLMFYYVNDTPADAVFCFDNCFNVPEWLPLNCVTTRKQTGDRSVAQVRRRAVIAHMEHEVEFEVNTAPLSTDEVSLVEQMCESPNVLLLPGDDEIVISNRTCEFSDERGELPSVKFTWKHRDGRKHTNVPHVEDDGIFSDEYDNNYD